MEIDIRTGFESKYKTKRNPEKSGFLFVWENVK
jgi:hypothetical protein